MNFSIHPVLLSEKNDGLPVFVTLPLNIVMRFLQCARCVYSFSPLSLLSVLERMKLFTMATLQGKKIVLSSHLYDFVVKLKQAPN